MNSLQAAGSPGLIWAHHGLAVHQGVVVGVESVCSLHSMTHIQHLLYISRGRDGHHTQLCTCNSDAAYLRIAKLLSSNDTRHCSLHAILEHSGFVPCRHKQVVACPRYGKVIDFRSSSHAPGAAGAPPSPMPRSLLPFCPRMGKFAELPASAGKLPLKVGSPADVTGLPAVLGPLVPTSPVDGSIEEGFHKLNEPDDQVKVASYKTDGDRLCCRAVDNQNSAQSGRWPILKLL